MALIETNNLTKQFKVNKNKSFIDYFKFKSQKQIVTSVDSVSFKINSGETVGLIGLNGAGKSTLIKMMTGILSPSSGSVRVFGNDPFEKREINNKKISTVFGQRSNLRRDVSPMESYYIIKDMYDVSDEDFKSRLDYLTDILDVKDFINNPVRTLSLGQRMKAELISAFLYNPQIVFLDEPTIGLDILTKDSILDFLNTIKEKTTIILTTHDFEDIERICDRVIILHHGKVINDSNKEHISQIYNIEKLEVYFEKIDENIKSKLLAKDLDLSFDNNKAIIDISNIKDRSELVKNIYDDLASSIDSIKFANISFKDSLKYFLGEKNDEF